jgi:hypothetical protein
MTDLLAALAAALLAVQAPPLDQAPPAAETSVPPASEALVDRFMTAIPASAQGPADNRGADPIQLELLAEINPGRIEEIRPILEAEAACEGPLRREMNGRMLRGVAAGLGEEKLGRLVRFYEGDDYHLFERLGREESGTLSESERAELERLLTDYPIEEYAQAISASFPAMFDDPAMEPLIRCGLDRARAFERKGLRLFPDPTSE